MHLMQARNVLILPGWRNSGPEHWQSLWQQRHGYTRVEQHDWEHPLRGDWMVQLEQYVLAADGPVVLVAHSLGCALVAAWAAHSQNVARVHAALLVAPPDTDSELLQPLLHSWTPLVRQRLPWHEGRSVLIASSDDPYCSSELAQQLALDWGARCENWGRLGHINVSSGLADWSAGHAVLRQLMALAMVPASGVVPH
jgi:predicted alpha/beta hydrolase family esterase